MSAFTHRFLVLAIFAFAAAYLVPPVSAAAPRQAKVIITLSRRGVYFLDGKRVTKAQIEPRLAARVRKNPSVVAVIRCDPGQMVSRVSDMIGLVKQAGVQSVTIASPFTIPPRK